MRIFKEKQKFNQLWLIILMQLVTLMSIGMIVGTYIKDPNSFSVMELILIVCIILFASGLIFLFNLTTRIDEKEIHYKFFLLHLKQKLYNGVS